MEMETDKDKLIEMPTMLASTENKPMNNETVYELDSNFSIIKKNDPAEPNIADKTDDFINQLSNPDNLIIPPTETHFVDLNFSTIKNLDDNNEKDNLNEITFDLNKICDEKFDLLEMTSTSNNSQISDISDNIDLTVDQSDNKALDGTVLLMDKQTNGPNQDTGIDIDSSNFSNQTVKTETIIGESSSTLEESNDSGGNNNNMLDQNSQTAKLDEIQADLNLNNPTDCNQPNFSTNETSEIKLDQNDEMIADNLLEHFSNKLNEQPSTIQINDESNQLPVQLSDNKLPPVISNDLLPEQPEVETGNADLKMASNLDKREIKSEVAEINEIDLPGVESVEKLEPLKFTEQIEPVNLDSSMANLPDQSMELSKEKKDLNISVSAETVPTALSTLSASPLLSKVETISKINPSNDDVDKTALTADDTATLTGVVSNKIAETINVAAAVASTLLGNNKDNEQPQPSASTNVHVEVNPQQHQKQLSTSVEEKGNVDDNAILPSEPIVEAIKTALVTDFLPTSASSILSSSVAKEVEKENVTEEQDDKQIEEAKSEDQPPVAPKTSIINENNKQSNNNEDEDDEDDDIDEHEDHKQQKQPEEQQEEKVVETLEEKFNDSKEEQQSDQQKQQESVIDNPEQSGTNLSSSSAASVKSVTPNLESIALAEQINPISIEKPNTNINTNNNNNNNTNGSSKLSLEETNLVQPIVSPLLSTSSPKSTENPVDSAVIDHSKNQSITMGKKNYQRQNSSENTSAATLEPDCIQQFVQTLFGQCAADILYWRDPKNTGAVFGVGLVILFSLTIFSVISVVAYTLLFTLLATLSFRVYKNVMQAVNKTEEGHPFKEYLDMDITPNQDRAHEIADQLLSHLNCFLTRMRSVILVEDYVESLKYLFLFWSLTFIGAWFNGMTLVILAYIGVFSLPKVYEMNQAQIDQYIELVASKINDITEKIPFLKKVTAEKKDN